MAIIPGVKRIKSQRFTIYLKAPKVIDVYGFVSTIISIPSPVPRQFLGRVKNCRRPEEILTKYEITNVKKEIVPRGPMSKIVPEKWRTYLNID